MWHFTYFLGNIFPQIPNTSLTLGIYMHNPMAEACALPLPQFSGIPCIPKSTLSFSHNFAPPGASWRASCRGEALASPPSSQRRRLQLFCTGDARRFPGIQWCRGCRRAAPWRAAQRCWEVLGGWSCSGQSWRSGNGGSFFQSPEVVFLGMESLEFLKERAQTLF